MESTVATARLEGNATKDDEFKCSCPIMPINLVDLCMSLRVQTSKFSTARDSLENMVDSARYGGDFFNKPLPTTTIYICIEK